ncbi:HsdM family class I SAM-dependent methyltransferase [Corynebacterium evansiae]|uniref:HsdM family class I SAM-dependent methyltransferase n=1 Tax=Corynebacterium evansiae TaxID=2913499 RepID=UPI0022B9ED13
MQLDTVYDPTAGTGGGLLVAARALKELNPDIEVVLAGQELMSTGYAIGKADLLIQGGEPDAIRHGDTLLTDLYEGEQFEYILSNPPFGMDWEVQQQSVKEQAKVPGSRFSHGLPGKDDGQMLFLAHVASKLMPAGPNGAGGRGAVVSNGSPLFTGASGSGPDKIRAWLLESDLVDAIIQLPTNMFYGTGISTYVWILDTNKEEHRKGFVQLIDASECWSVPDKGLGEKRREMKEPDRKRVLEEYAAFEDTEISKVLASADLGFHDVKVTKQKRLHVAVTPEAVAQVLEHKSAVPEHADVLADVADVKFNDLPEALKAAAKKRGVKMLAGMIDEVLEAVGVPDENAEPSFDRKGNPILDPAFSMTERIPLTEDVGEHMEREVLPFALDVA